MLRRVIGPKFATDLGLPERLQDLCLFLLSTSIMNSFASLLIPPCVARSKGRKMLVLSPILSAYFSRLHFPSASAAAPTLPSIRWLCRFFVIGLMIAQEMLRSLPFSQFSTFTTPGRHRSGDPALLSISVLYTAFKSSC